MTTTAAESWEVLVAAHRERQRQSIPNEWLLDDAKLAALKGTGSSDEGRLIQLDAVSQSGLLSQAELDITSNFAAHELVDKLARGELSSEDVVRAYCKRAALAQQLTSCLTEIFFDEALERAKSLDAQFKATGIVSGPLHGLPISLKDSYNVKGKYSTAGYTALLRRPVPEDNAAIVNLLLDAGAVMYCKTNVPQTMMTADSDNNIFGRTLNPHNTKLTAGGSTGGEGALVAFRGSPLGVGSDIAGSIRIPSFCCGIYGFKPTVDRVPFSGQTSSPAPEMHLAGIKPAAGPMANSVDDLVLFMKTVLGKRPWKYDATAIDSPWRSVAYAGTKPLTIGLLPEDPEYLLQPPVRRALETAAALLEKAGHTIVRLPAEPTCSVGLGGKLGFQFFFLPGGDLAGLADALGEPLVPSVAKGVHPFMDGKFPIAQDKDLLHKWSDWTDVADQYADAWRETWVQHGLDVLLAPGAGTTACPHDAFGNPVYTLMWNVLNYPAGILPFGFASKKKDPEFQKHEAFFDPDYEPEVYNGAPCAVQVIAPRFRDEECLHAMTIIDTVLKQHQ
ncbi:hypothetical protein SEUCBS140593_010512 [Sporothrix eucalyptigena]|uniref:Amidase domain-containing protein n=1 Tax=Sporothrix eucalyptigena TaxID=1812306 RepID=A0ABP0D244_9PEZI